MAGEYNKRHEYESKTNECGPVETQDRGLFDFLGKKKEEEVIKVSEPAEPSYYEEPKKKEEGHYGHYEEPKEKEEGHFGHYEEPRKEYQEEKKHESLYENKPYGHYEEPKKEYEEEKHGHFEEPKKDYEEEKKHESFAEKLRRSDSSSSSVSNI